MKYMTASICLCIKYCGYRYWIPRQLIDITFKFSVYINFLFFKFTLIFVTGENELN